MSNRAGFGVEPRQPAGGPPPAGAGGRGPAPGGAQAGGPPFVGGSAATDPLEVTRYSEQDVMSIRTV